MMEYELNPGQEVSLLQTKYCLSKNVINILASMSTKKNLDFDLLEKAFNKLAERNDCLRIRFVKRGKQLKQYFLDKVEFNNIPRLNFNTKEEQENFVRQIRKKAIDYKHGVVIEPFFIKTFDNKSMVFIKVCHLILDMYGISILFKDLFGIYKAMEQGTDLPPALTSFEDLVKVDVTKKNNEKINKEHKEFFTKYLESREEPFYTGIPGHNCKILQKQEDKGKRARKMFFIKNDTEGHLHTIDSSLTSQIIKFCEENRYSISDFLFYAMNICASNLNNNAEHMLPLELCNCRSTAQSKNCAGVKVQSIGCYTDINYNKTFTENFKDFCANQMQLYRYVNFSDQAFEMLLHKTYKTSLMTTYYSFTFSFIPFAPEDDDLEFEIYSNGKGALHAYVAAFLNTKKNIISVAYDCQTKIINAKDVEEFHKNYIRIIKKIMQKPDEKLEFIKSPEYIPTPKNQPRLLTEVERNKDTLFKEGPYTSTKDVLERLVKYYPTKNLLADLDKQKNIVYHTSEDIYEDVESIGEGLIDLGLENKHIAIMSENCYNYVMCDLAIASGVGIVTPIDKDAPADLLEKLFNKCDADAVICSAYLIEKINEVLPNCPRLKTIITIDKKVENYPFLEEIKAKGKELAPKGYYKNKKLDLNAPAKLLFTSGTTGMNKGVILSQNNIAANIANCMLIKGESDETNTSMSILPMHHATEINTHIFTRMAAGRLTYINDNMKNMMTNIKIFKPYVITIVPMIANAFYNTIWANAKKAGKDEKLKKGIKLCKLMNKFGKDITHTLFKEVYEPFGGNLKQIVCGGAMLNPEVVQGFKDLGVYIVNGYGITECGPLISMNTETYEEVYSVGKIGDTMEVKIADKNEDGLGELCVKGKNVSSGYYNDPEATAQAFDKDGFFHTGDLVTMDENGRLYLSGRKKNAIVLENGKNICPEEIEHEILINIPYASESVVYMAPFTNKQGKEINGLCVGLFIQDEEIRKDTAKIIEDFRNLNKTLPTYKQLKFIDLKETEFEKTSTRKIKRDKLLDIHNKNKGLIL